MNKSFQLKNNQQPLTTRAREKQNQMLIGEFSGFDRKTIELVSSRDHSQLSKDTFQNKNNQQIRFGSALPDINIKHTLK